MISSHRWSPGTGPARGRLSLVSLFSGNFFSLLGVNAVLGRTISAERRSAGQSSARRGAWLWLFGAGTSVLIPRLSEKTLMLNGVNYNVIGVTQARFTGLLVGFEPDFWAPHCDGSNKSQGTKEGLATGAYIRS